MLRKITKRLFSKPLQIWAKWYFKISRKYRYKQINGVILPGVFYPFFTISTKLLMDFIEPLDLKEKSFLELGCGTGMISTLAAKIGAKVTASDINPVAIENASINAKKNGVVVQTIFSDLFKDIPKQNFDYIIINPPYYPKSPQNEAEQAWFCGENFEYFKKLFKELGGYFNSESKVYMVLSEDCELEKIKSLAAKQQLNFKLDYCTKRQGEENYIFSIKKA